MTLQAQHWTAHPRAARLLGAAVLVLPLAAAVGAGLLAARLLDDASRPLRFVAVLAVALAVLTAGERAARRLLPLAALLSLSLVFPDRAPGRFALALRAGSTRELVQLRRAGPQTSAQAAEQVLVLLASLARHDPGSRRHSERVRAYVDLLAEALALPAEDRDRLRWASLLHDLGKTSVDVSVLRKPARLDADEWELVRGHPAAGEQLAAGLRDFLGPWFDGIGQHHERWDGSGYPRGLAGEQISYAGRIVAVADALEVMTASRPYQRPVDPGAARAELVRCGGTQFDPAVVRALLGVSIPRLRRVLGPVAALGLLPAVAGRVPDPTHVAHTGSDAPLPLLPPAHDPDPGGMLVGLHPVTALPPDASVAGGAVPTGHDAGGSAHHASAAGAKGGAAVDADQR